MISRIMIVSGGILTLGMAFFHQRFPKMFGWKDDFDKIGKPKGKIHYTIHLALLLLFIGIGLLSISFSSELSRPVGLGMGICILISLFWLWRTIWQLLYFKLPKGPLPKAPVVMHYVMTICFLVLTITYSYPVIEALIAK